MNNIISKSELLLKSLQIYYNDENKLNIILPILLGKSQISISLLNNFVTKYSKKNIIIISNNNIYTDYKLQLKSYKKIYFDCFSRNKRIKLYISKNEYLITTVGQLNFFKWIIDNNILNYIMSNYNLILQYND